MMSSASKTTTTESERLSQNPKVVVFGAGATGRGHVGLLAWQAGAQMVFADINEGLVRALQQAGSYRVNIYNGKTCTQVEVRPAQFLSARDREAVAGEIVDADLVLTSVFDQNLPDVALTMALAAKSCREAGRSKPLNVIACENMQNSSSTLGWHVRERLNGKDLDYCCRYFGFPDCMISRVVPQPEPDPLVITAEDYNEWTARREDFKGQPPAWLAALQPVDNQDARLERKLFMHNGGHAICGYFGFHYGHRYIHEAVADPKVAQCVVNACNQIGEVVRRKHGIPVETIQEYKEDLYRRGAIPEMRDQVLRVVRQPLRKLGGQERLIGPARLAPQYGLPRDHVVRGIVAALKYYHPDDLQSVEMRSLIAGDGVKGLLCKVSQLPPGDSLITEVEQAWAAWRL
jgi:mannitol-1-phosphate 5-dehydrogenase